MATQVPYKLYKPNHGGKPDLLPDLNMTNSAYARSQHTEISPQDFLTNYYNQDKAYYDDYYSRSTTPGVKEAFQQIVSGGANNAPIQSGYVIDDKGTFTTQSAINSQAANQAAVAAGTMREISPGMYIPTGSAADLQLQGKTFEQQLATPSVQNQIQQQGLTPVNPATPTQTTQPGQVTGVLPDGNKATFMSEAIAKTYGATKIEPIVPVHINPSTTTNTDNLSGKPVTGLDIQSKVQGLTPSQQAVIDATKQTPREAELTKELQALKTGELQGTTTIEGQTIPQPLIGLQSQKLRMDIAFQAAPLIDELEILAGNRQATLQALTMAQQFGVQNKQLQMQADAARRAEEEAAKKFAVDYDIKSPYYRVGDTIYPTGGGAGFVDAADFERRTGMTLDQAGEKGLIQMGVSAPEKLQFGVIGQTIDEYGNPVNQYGFVDLENGTLRPTGVNGNVSTGSSYTDAIGNITAYGSPLWKHGLDIDLQKGQPVPSPVSGEVIFAGTNGGFGGQVKVRALDGNEVWLSHLDSQSVKFGQQVTAGQVIGIGGNTGNVIPMGGGDGSHLDLTVKTPNGYMTPQEVESYANGMFGKTASSTTSNPITQAMNQLLASAKLDSKDRTAIQRNVNTLLAQGNTVAAADALLTSAIDTLDVGAKERVQGFYDAIKNLQQIQTATDEFISAGGDINLLAGTAEQVAQKLGTTTDPKLAYIATRIRVSTFAFINSFSGAAFTDSERKNYTDTFPAITNTNTLFDAKVKAITDTFNSNIESRLGTKLGKTNYETLINIVYTDPYEEYGTHISTGQGSGSSGNWLDSILGPSNTQQTSSSPAPSNNAFSARGWWDVTKDVGRGFADTFKSAFGG